MALFSNQRYELRPEALIPTYSQVVSIKSSVGLSNLKCYTSLWSVKGIRIAFQVYLFLEDMGGPEKDQVLFQHHIIFLASFSSYSSCQLDVSWHNCNSFGMIAHKLESSNSPTKYASIASCNPFIAVAGISSHS